MKKVLGIIFILSVLIVGGGLFTLLGQFYASYDGADVKFTITPGESFASVNGRLTREGLIASPRLFHRYNQLIDNMGNLKAGTYTIPNGATITDISYILTKGTPELTRVTIPEGKNMFEIGNILEESGITTYQDFVQYSRNKSAIKKLIGVDAPSLEGYLFPETYMFSKNTPAAQVAQTMVRQFKTQTQSIDLKHPKLSPHEVVILASIVEKETGAKWERPDIAGVYLNRLKKRMRLQADPTTIYGIWENFDGNLRRKHLLEKTDYNTYKMSGLPLGPIANPSLAAIKAVLNPNQHNYLYFVSKNDGTHIFTPTYKEHLKAVEYWQKNRSRRQGRSWRDLKQD
ncbi:MAG: aminodeoxychorismate lyase [Halobacteriovoraceae bacterium]|nr:aminodeoxychorismate lyase [Halobacteriovoraceae bacterium]|tara:strand:+ start:12727 stop:13755 length:1029 start_codon:yes stop_codon:yes gene_type:complete